MKERIKKIRIEKNLTQQKFADMLKTSRNNIAGYEAGSRTPSDAAINNICITFNVREEWLRTGEEPMYIESDTFSLDDFLSKQNVDDLEIEFIKLYFELDESTRKDILNKFKEKFMRKTVKDDAPYIPDDPKELEGMRPPIEDNQKNKDVG